MLNLLSETWIIILSIVGILVLIAILVGWYESSVEDSIKRRLEPFEMSCNDQFMSKDNNWRIVYDAKIRKIAFLEYLGEVTRAYNLNEIKELKKDVYDGMEYREQVFVNSYFGFDKDLRPEIQLSTWIESSNTWKSTAQNTDSEGKPIKKIFLMITTKDYVYKLEFGSSSNESFYNDLSEADKWIGIIRNL